MNQEPDLCAVFNAQDALELLGNANLQHHATISSQYSDDPEIECCACMDLGQEHGHDLHYTGYRIHGITPHHGSTPWVLLHSKEGSMQTQDHAVLYKQDGILLSFECVCATLCASVLHELPAVEQYAHRHRVIPAYWHAVPIYMTPMHLLGQSAGLSKNDTSDQ